MIHLLKVNLLVALVLHCVNALSLQLDTMTTMNGSCSGGSTPCGPVSGSVCCPPGYVCNPRRGIPQCEDLSYPLVSTFTGGPCTDPYLRDCSKTGITGYCCPIGTVCFHNSVGPIITCIDAHGATASPFPSATLGVVPVATPVANSNPNVVYSPENAWSNSNTAPGCAQGRSLQVTSTINSTISFNYSGPSIMVHVVTSSQGGVFSVFIDDFNTTSTIDTFSDNKVQLPLCYPMQYPPVLKPPSDLELQNNHTITLVYIGSSHNAAKGTYSNIQFDSFAIPEFKIEEPPPTASGVRTTAGRYLMLSITAILSFSMMPIVLL